MKDAFQSLNLSQLDRAFIVVRWYVWLGTLAQRR